MERHRFEIKEDFLLDGKPFQIISGSIHYFRVVPEYWRDRLEKLRAMGCNTVETYVPWNLHEPAPGQFCFTGMLDLAAFLRTAQELGLWAIVRPSPYICAEWEFGGLPAWLLAQDGMRLRCAYPPFLEAVRRYYQALCPILAPLQAEQGGPILMLQVENEYGSYGDDKEYLAALRDMMREYGITAPLFTSDGAAPDYLLCGTVEGAHPTANFGSRAKEQLGSLRQFQKTGPLLCTEFWIGWFDAWGNEHHTAPAEKCAADLDDILSMGSVNFYMFHGGTSFGFTNGANYYETFSPDVTSYDYDAPLSECGDITPKYMAFREVIGKYAPLPEMRFSTHIEKKAFGPAEETGRASLFPQLDALAGKVRSPFPLSMEKLGQSYGYVLYRSEFLAETRVELLHLMKANDRAQVFLDGAPLLTLYDQELQKEQSLPEPASGKKIDILVENMGRVNYGRLLEYQRKGIDGGVWVNRRFHFGWDMYALPMDAAMSASIDFSGEWAPGSPAFYRFRFQVSGAADTFLELPGWGKGCVLLNGFQLGRFWEVGPQRKLYVPAPLLREGENELILFESEGKPGSAPLFTAEP